MKCSPDYLLFSLHQGPPVRVDLAEPGGEGFLSREKLEMGRFGAVSLDDKLAQSSRQDACSCAVLQLCLAVGSYLDGHVDTPTQSSSHEWMLSRVLKIGIRKPAQVSQRFPSYLVS